MNSIILENDMSVDVFARLLNDRALFINGAIDDVLSTEICASLLAKDLENNKQIQLFINSVGGDIQDVLTIYDTIKVIKSPVRTIAIGEVSCEAVLILAAGSKGNRFATKNSIIELSKILHDSYQYSDLTDAKIHLEYLNMKNEAYNNALAECIGKKRKELDKLLQTKHYLSAEKAVEFGIIDKVVKTKEVGK
jgi:ATP-dependent Clp protease protease subunit